MNKGKAERLRKELTDKYGDKEVMKLVDFYYPVIQYPSGTWDENIIGYKKVSEVKLINYDDYKEIEKILRHGCRKAEMMKVYVKLTESEERYNSPEEVEKRKKNLSGFLFMTGYLNSMNTGINTSTKIRKRNVGTLGSELGVIEHKMNN